MNARARSRDRQRQRLIDACISALHIHGPSRTTVEKVVSIAKMSPGIVRFYFESKAAMLVASLQFLAAEFEEQLLVPVANLKATPVAALELLVQLYLDPDIASPRKVSVWYAFWGEANSRQEYYDICGQKDESFAALVRDLIGSLIHETAQPHLDPDGIALGLIGVLEMLWQDFAFRTEAMIDRAAARRRCRAYLRSIFPTRFAATPGAAVPLAAPALAAGPVPDAGLHARERALLFLPAWTVLGHESQCVHAGEFLSLDIGVERVLLVRDRAGRLVGLRNACPESPHALVSRRTGRFDGDIVCKLHGQHFSWDGRRSGGAGPSNLTALELVVVAGLVYARSPAANAPAPAGFATEVPPGLMALDDALEIPVAADWKLVVEQWLALASPHATASSEALADRLVWQSRPLRSAGWSESRYGQLIGQLTGCSSQDEWRCEFLPPNQLLERRPDGLSVLQVFPTGAGRSHLRRLDFTVLAPDEVARAIRSLARRIGPYARRATCEYAESWQSGVVEFGYRGSSAAAPSALTGWFRDWCAKRLSMPA